ncbi:hypothetical protein [Halopseudomonas aestusnigri]|uniref:hypothetical protein n=1 Tax=Halopseudomonas aestusnigri TaxID=857252 RepID=UPI003002FC34
MQPSYQEFAANIAALHAGQVRHDNQSPAGEERDEKLEAACTQFAQEFTANQMDTEDFFEYAKAFAGECLADYIATDDEYKLLQLVLLKSGNPLAESIIGRLYAAAYDYKKDQLNGK